MPLRKNGTIVRTALVAAVIGCAVVPTTANAGILSGLLTPKTPTPTAKAVATPTPKAVTATPTPTPAPTVGTSGTAVTTVAATTNQQLTSAAVPAGSNCTQLPTTKAFKGVDGDNADYSLAPNGDFESGTGGWTLTGGAKVVTANETLGVTKGRSALQMPLSSTATSPAFCVDETNPNFRFVYKVDNAVLSGFIAYVIYRNQAGAITNVELVSSKALAMAPSTWQASPVSPLATLIPLNASSKTASVQLKITSLNPTDFVLDTSDAIIGENAATQAVHTVGSLGSGLVAATTGLLGNAANIGVTIDSVMIDPYRRG